MNSETSLFQKSNLESVTNAEKPSSSEPFEESINRIASTETDSCSPPPTQKKESCALEESISDVTSQLVSIQS